MRNQLAGVDAVGGVLGGGGDPIAPHAGWCYPSWAKLVHMAAVDLGEGFAEVVR